MNKAEYLLECERLWDAYVEAFDAASKNELVNNLNGVEKPVRMLMLQQMWELVRAVPEDECAKLSALRKTAFMIENGDDAHRKITSSLPVKEKIPPEENIKLQKELKEKRLARIAIFESTVEQGKANWEDLRLQVQQENDPTMLLMFDKYAKAYQEGNTRAARRASRKEECQAVKQALKSKKNNDTPVVEYVYETRIQQKVYRQLRSNGGVIRLESGDGK